MGLVFILAALISVSATAQQQPVSDPVLQTMKQELNRAFSTLKKSPTPPYFLSYQLTDNRAINVTSSFGALTSSTDSTTRLLDVDLRLGDYKLDSSHEINREFEISTFGQTRGQLPLEND